MSERVVLLNTVDVKVVETQQLARTGLVVATPRMAMENAVASKDIGAVVNALKAGEATSKQIALAGCNAIVELCAADDKIHLLHFYPEDFTDVEARELFAEYGGCSELAKLLKAFGDVDANVAARTLRAISCVARNRACQVDFERTDVCEMVVKCLQRLGATNKDVAIQGCLAIYSLLSSLALYRRFRDIRAWGEVTVKCLKRFGETERQVALKCFIIIQEFAPFDVCFVEAGACEAVAKCLKRYAESDQEVARYGCSVIASLAWNNGANQRRLGDAGACEAVVKCLQQFGETDKYVAENGCGAIISLIGDNDDNKRRLQTLNVALIVSRSKKNTHRKCAMQALGEEAKRETCRFM